MPDYVRPALRLVGRAAYVAGVFWLTRMAAKPRRSALHVGSGDGFGGRNFRGRLFGENKLEFCQQQLEISL